MFPDLIGNLLALISTQPAFCMFFFLNLSVKYDFVSMA